MDICSFELCGDFATFRKPDTNSVYLTYNNPPYTSILGILGSVLGMSGYSAKKKNEVNILPQFYKNLSNIWISFYPIFTRRPVFLKQMITFNNYHGYGSDAGGYQITEQILISPRWKIFLFDETGKHSELFKRLERSQTAFTPYLGKNEFRAEISGFKRIEAVEIPRDELRNKSIRFNSVVLLNKIDENPIKKSLSSGMGLEEYFETSMAQKNIITEDGYSMFENYPYALGANLHYKLCLSAFTNWELDTKIVKTGPGTRFFKLENDEVIQMFNGELP